MARLNFERDTSFAAGCPVSGSTTYLTTTVGTADGVNLEWPGVYRLYVPKNSWICMGISGSCDADSTSGFYAPGGLVEYFSTLSGSTWFSANGVTEVSTINLTKMSASQEWIR